MSDENYVPWAVFRILLILIVTTILTSVVSIRFSTKDFEKLRCSPSVIPFVSMLNPKISSLDNFHYCIKKIVTPLVKKKTSKELDQPMNTIIESVSKSNKNISEITNASNEFVDRFHVAQNSIQEAFERSRFMGFYMSQKIQHFFSKMVSTVVVFYFMLITMINSIFIIISGLLKISAYLIKTGTIMMLSPFLPMQVLGLGSVVLGTSLKISDEIAKSKSKSQS